MNFESFERLQSLPAAFVFNLTLYQVFETKHKSAFSVPITAQVNLCQKLFFLQNMLCTKIVLNVRNNFCTQHVLPRFELGIFMY
jgi:hypothetical protein